MYVFIHFLYVQIFRVFRFKTIFLAPLGSVFFVNVKNSVLYRILQCIRRVGSLRLCRNYMFFHTFRAVPFSFFPFEKWKIQFCIVFYNVFGVWGVPDCAETICFSTLFARCHFRSFRSISAIWRKSEFCIVFYISNCSREKAFSSSCAFRPIFYTLLLTPFSLRASVENEKCSFRVPILDMDTCIHEGSNSVAYTNKSRDLAAKSLECFQGR